MNELDVYQYVMDHFKGVDYVDNADNRFFFYNPDPNAEQDHMFPFMTVMTNDVNDQFSNLDRPSIYRINVGVAKNTFLTLFGAAFNDEEATKYDFTALDKLMPHPVYGRQYWVSVLNPSDDTFEAKVLPLINESYDAAVTRHDKKAASRPASKS